MARGLLNRRCLTPMNIAAAGAVEIHLLSVAPLLDEQAHSVVDMYPVYVYRDYMVNHVSESERIKQGLQDYLDQVSRRIDVLVTMSSALSAWASPPTRSSPMPARTTAS